MRWGDMKDGAANSKAFFAGFATLTAGGGGDATEVDGEWLDRKGYSWAKVIIWHRATFSGPAGAQTLSLAANLQSATSNAGAGAADFGDPMTVAVVNTSESGGSTELACTELHFDLTMAERYIRAQFTPDLSAAGTDTATVGCIILLGGYIEGPASVPAN